MNKSYGYVRVSTKYQNIDRQLSAMKSLGINDKYIFIDKMSGVHFERPKYKKLLRKLKPNDTVYIKSIDRLGRNYDEIIKQWHYLVKEKGVDIVVIDFPLLDTRENVNGITGKFLADVILQVLSYVAQVEKENTHQRQMEGIYEAQKKGIKFGRPIKEKPEEFDSIYCLWLEERISQREAARRLGVNHATFRKWANEKLGIAEFSNSGI